MNLDKTSKIILKSDDVRIYRNATLITSGEWTDSISRTPITYTDVALKLSARYWKNKILNVDHEWKVLNTIGTIENPYYHKGAIKGDLFIPPITQNRKDAIALIDNNEVNSLSVELMSQDVWDADTCKRYATDIEYIGCALIYGDNGACSDAKIR